MNWRCPPSLTHHDGWVKKTKRGRAAVLRRPNWGKAAALPYRRKDLWGLADQINPHFPRKVLAPGAGEGVSIRCSLTVHGWLCHPTVASAGNLVKFEGGCATVTGYNLPSPLVPPSGAGKAGVRSETRKSGHQHGYTLVGSRPRGAASPSKRRMRPARWNCFSADCECLHSPFCRSLKVFYFQAHGTGLQTRSPPTGTMLKDQS